MDPLAADLLQLLLEPAAITYSRTVPMCVPTWFRSAARI